MDVDAWDAYVDQYGHAPQVGPDGTPVEEMFMPVRCGCGQVYDAGSVEVTQRYLDCSMWITPCCRRLTDSRPQGWGSGPGYTELRRGGRQR